MNELVSKYVAQLRYIPTLNFFDNMFNVAASLEGGEEFEHWRAKRNPDSALLFDMEGRRGLNIDARSITYATEKSVKDSELSDKLIKYATLFLEGTNVTKFNHVGIRRTGIFETNLSYDVYVKRFFEAFLNKDVGLDAIVTDTIDDTLYVLEGTKDGFTTRLKLAPLKKHQFREHFSIEEFTPEDLDLRKETSIVIDIDFFTQIETDEEAALDNLRAIEISQREAYDSVVELVRAKTLQ